MMSNEEIIKGLESVKGVCGRHFNEGGAWMAEFLDVAIKSLEQEDVVDKIVSEIEHTGAYEQEINGKTEFLEGITYCLNLLNKYKAESEDEN